MTLGNYFISPADGVSNDHGGAQPTRLRTPPPARREPPAIAPVTEGSAADAPGTHPRAPGARPRTLQPRRALRARGAADAQSRRGERAGLTCRPPLLGCRAAAPPPLGAGPSLPRTGRSLAEQRGSSDVPALSSARYGGREGKTGSGAGGGAPPAAAPRPLLVGQPHNHALPKFKSPRHCGSERSIPLHAAPSGQTGHTGGCQTAAAPLIHRALRRAAVLPGLYRGETPATATPRRGQRDAGTHR